MSRALVFFFAATRSVKVPGVSSLAEVAGREDPGALRVVAVLHLVEALLEVGARRDGHVAVAGPAGLAGRIGVGAVSCGGDALPLLVLEPDVLVLPVRRARGIQRERHEQGQEKEDTGFLEPAHESPRSSGQQDEKFSVQIRQRIFVRSRHPGGCRDLSQNRFIGFRALRVPRGPPSTPWRSRRRPSRSCSPAGR